MTNEEFLKHYQQLAQSTTPQLVYFHTESYSWCSASLNSYPLQADSFNPITKVELELVKAGVSAVFGIQNAQIQRLEALLQEQTNMLSTLVGAHSRLLNRVSILETRLGLSLYGEPGPYTTVIDESNPNGERPLTIGDL